LIVSYSLSNNILITGEQLKELAHQRLAEAQLLYENGFYQGAYYLGGYAVEFALKALICKRLGFEVFGSRQAGLTDVSKALQVHHLPTLLAFAGLFPMLEEEKNNNEAFFKAWSKVSEWSEQRRYSPLECSPQTVINFINATENVMLWIFRNY
jgi:AbiV family abortive infection protein